MKIHSIETLLSDRRKVNGESAIPFLAGGQEFTATKRLVNGEMETLELVKPIGEMLTSGSLEQLKELGQKVVLDVELGREQVPLLYTPIYDRMENANMPRLIDANWAVSGNVVFTEHIEGEEVKFGRLSAEKGPVARVLTYAAAFEYTKEMKDFNDTFSVEVLNRSMGEAYNALLNHIHLSPIIAYNYKAANKTAYKGAETDNTWVGMYKTLTAALGDARVAKRPGSVLLASGSDQPNIEMALKGGYQIEGTTYPAVGGIDAVIYYDGWSVNVGRKTYEYAGVTQGKAYLIRPKRGFKELVKRDLTVEATMPDISRLIESQIVGFAYRGAFAALDENVQEITLASA